MLSVHVEPSTTANGELKVYGAPPLRVVPSEQLRLQPTSFAYHPPEQVIAEEIVEHVEPPFGSITGLPMTPEMRVETAAQIKS
eukprot:scaffold43634_cov64-Phaeocystis_antarctica.AAC.3